MRIAADVVVGLVGLMHVYFLILEMFLWEKRARLRAFGMTREFAASTRVLAANQGLYNGFLAAGLFWGLSLGTRGHLRVAGGRVSVSRKIRGATARRRRLCRRARRRAAPWGRTPVRDHGN